MTLPARPATLPGEAESLSFAIHDSALGQVLVARSANGICAILLGDDRPSLILDLRSRFPHAELAPGDTTLDALAARVATIVESPEQSLDERLDMRGTDFQRDVWSALREIPAGTTATYTDIAIRVGRLTSVRAVARACAANPLAVVVPCHRVLRGDGQLSGYRWGLDRKRQLLSREASA
jgi:AraC family transcriptional regulator of adaptative response/methylated-DNA-[protein]-cysteine methyltransferase